MIKLLILSYVIIFSIKNLNFDASLTLLYFMSNFLFFDCVGEKIKYCDQFKLNETPQIFLYIFYISSTNGWC
jgi:hypothetical protein